jgi:hypothetical protein
MAAAAGWSPLTEIEHPAAGQIMPQRNSARCFSADNRQIGLGTKRK